jgi:nucleotide-binding universal stress UspA family protein
MGRLLLGSVADKIMRGARTPVILARDAVPIPTRFTRLLVALDGSDLAEEALPVALELARASGATLRLTRVVTPFLQSFVSVAPEAVMLSNDEIAEIDEHAMGEAGAYLQAVAARLREEGVTVEVDVRYGTARDELLRAAETYAPELLVAATHGRGGFRRWALGSVTTELVQRAPCPMLVVPCADQRRSADKRDGDRDAAADAEDVPTSWL